MRLPSELAEAVAGWKGDVATQWVEALPLMIAAAEERWGIKVDAPFEPGGFTSYVAPALLPDGSDVVYKITIPHAEASGEAEALDVYAGDGAVRLVDAKQDTYELLLERCAPGNDLWTVEDDSERLGIATNLMQRLWSRPDVDSVARLSSVAPRWADVTERRMLTLDMPWIADPIEHGIDLLRSLPHDAQENVLIHGDFHPGNILASLREPWLVIDPKPMIGDPAYEPTQLLTQQNGRVTETPPPVDVERRLEHIAGLAGLDVERVGLWALARSSEWSMWSLDHGAVVDAAIEYTWARTLSTILID